MSIPRIEGLRLENWLALSDDQRLGALQTLENSLAAQEHRAACQVDYTSNCPSLKPQDRESTLGLQTGDKIYIKDSLIKGNFQSPYVATEKLFHESRHAYQEHAVANPASATEDQQTLDDWGKNLSKDGYMTSGAKGSALYRWQPIEKDANEVALQRTQELYSGEFADHSDSYAKYKQDAADTLAFDEYLGQTNISHSLGADDYAEKARDEMLEGYQENQALKHHNAESVASSAPTKGQSTEPRGEHTEQTTEQEENDHGLPVVEPAGVQAAEPVTSSEKNSDSESQSSSDRSEKNEYSQGYGF